MPRRRIEMRKLKEVLRLRLTAGLSNRKIALCTGIAQRQSLVCANDNCTCIGAGIRKLGS